MTKDEWLIHVIQTKALCFEVYTSKQWTNIINKIELKKLKVKTYTIFILLTLGHSTIIFQTWHFSLQFWIFLFRCHIFIFVCHSFIEVDWGYQIFPKTMQSFLTIIDLSSHPFYIEITCKWMYHLWINSRKTKIAIFINFHLVLIRYISIVFYWKHLFTFFAKVIYGM